MISFRVINPILLKFSSTDILLKEEPIPEIHLVNLTYWGWVLFLGVVILIVWLLIIFQARLSGSHPYEMSQNPITITGQKHINISVLMKIMQSFFIIRLGSDWFTEIHIQKI